MPEKLGQLQQPDAGARRIEEVDHGRYEFGNIEKIREIEKKKSIYINSCGTQLQWRCDSGAYNHQMHD